MANVRGLHHGAQGEVVFFDRQGHDRMCGLHCMNNLLQGPVFTKEYVHAQGLAMDAQERAVGLREATSQNVASDGYFSITVLEKCLSSQGLVLIPFRSPQVTDLRTNPAKNNDGFLCNLYEHWFSIRPVKGRYFKLDSLRPGPEAVAESHLRSFLDSVSASNYTVFVVRHRDWPSVKLPEPDPSKYPSIRQLPPSPNEPLEGPAFMPFSAATALNEMAERSEPPKDSNKAQPPAEHRWPETGGRQLGDAGLMNGNEDEDIVELLVESAMQSRLELPEIEDEDLSSEAIALRIQDPTVSKPHIRRFAPNSPVESVFTWLFKDLAVTPRLVPALWTREQVVLTASFPTRIFARTSEGRIWMEGKDVTATRLGDFFSRSETLNLSYSSS